MPPELLQLARRLVWWKPPEEALRTPDRLVAQVMALGTWEDIQLAKRQWGEASFRRVLAAPPPGVFDKRSWHYWHVMFDFDPTPPLPVRHIPEHA
jgi:hypothetical protein